jgi:hypothetical protein
MENDPHKAPDLSTPRIIVSILGLAVLFFLLAYIFLYFPSLAQIIGRLLATLVMAVIVVVIHRSIRQTRDDDGPGGSEPPAASRAAMVRRILLVWAVLFVLNSLFFAV